MSAGSVDVLTSGVPDCDVDASRLERVGELLDVQLGGGSLVAQSCRFEGDEVDMGAEPHGNGCQLVGLVEGVIYPVHHRRLDGEAMADWPALVSLGLRGFGGAAFDEPEEVSFRVTDECHPLFGTGRAEVSGLIDMNEMGVADDFHTLVS